jgi:hypothetical protein
MEMGPRQTWQILPLSRSRATVPSIPSRCRHRNGSDEHQCSVHSESGALVEAVRKSPKIAVNFQLGISAIGG